MSAAERRPHGSTAADDDAVARPPESFVDYALDGIRRELISGGLQPGERIAADALARKLGVSHIPVREALRTLEAEGQLVRDGRRLMVAPLSTAEAEDIYRTRELIESELIRLGVPALTEADDRHLAALVAEMEDAASRQDQPRYQRLTRRFHFTPFERARRPWLVRFLRILWDASARYQRPLFVDGGWRSGHVGHHRHLLECFADRDVEGVNRIMREHRRWLVGEVRRSGAEGGSTAEAHHDVVDTDPERHRIP